MAAHRLPRMDTLALTAFPRSDEKACSRDVPALLLRDRSCIYAPASLRRLREKAEESGISVGCIADTKTVGCGATLQAEGGHTVGSIAVPLEQFGEKQAPFVTETAVQGALALTLAWMK